MTKILDRPHSHCRAILNNRLVTLSVSHLEAHEELRNPHCESVVEVVCALPMDDRDVANRELVDDKTCPRIHILVDSVLWP